MLHPAMYPYRLRPPQSLYASYVVSVITTRILLCDPGVGARTTNGMSSVSEPAVTCARYSPLLQLDGIVDVATAGSQPAPSRYALGRTVNTGGFDGTPPTRPTPLRGTLPEDVDGVRHTVTADVKRDRLAGADASRRAQSSWMHAPRRDVAGDRLEEHAVDARRRRHRLVVVELADPGATVVCEQRRERA